MPSVPDLICSADALFPLQSSPASGVTGMNVALLAGDSTVSRRHNVHQTTGRRRGSDTLPPVQMESTRPVGAAAAAAAAQGQNKEESALF